MTNEEIRLMYELQIDERVHEKTWTVPLSIDLVSKNEHLEPIKVKKTYFEKFFKIIENIHSSIMTDNKEKKSTEKRVNQFIKTKNYDLVYGLINNGYKLNKKQTANVQNHIDEILIRSREVPICKLLENYLSIGFKISENKKEQYLYTLITNNNDLNEDYSLSFFLNEKKNMKIYFDNKSMELPYLTKDLRDYAKEKFVTTQLSQLMKHILDKRSPYKYKGGINTPIKSPKEDKYNAKNVENLLNGKYTEVLIKHIMFNDFLDFTVKLESVYPNGYSQVKVMCQNIIKKYYKEAVNESVINSNKGEIVINEIKSPNIELKIIPQEAKEILENIEKLYENIKHSKLEEFDTINLVEKKVPEILRKYLTIDEKYKENLINNEGKTAEELIIESLKNINSHLEKIWVDVNQQKLNSLSVTNRYTRNFK